MKIHDEQPILPTIISYLSLYLSVNDPNSFQQHFQDMDSISSFIEASIIIDPMRSCLYFMRCATLENPLEIRKQLESGLKLEKVDSDWIWSAWRFGTLLSYQAQDWEGVLSWSTKTINILKNKPSNISTQQNEIESVGESVSNNSTSSERTALNIESYFTARHVMDNILERPQYEDPNHNQAEMLFYRGFALQELGFEDEARQNFDMTLEIFPEFGEPYNNLALQSEQIGDWSSALEAYQILLKLEPTNISYLFRTACTIILQMEVLNPGSEEYITYASQAIQLFTDALDSHQKNSGIGETFEITEDQIYVNRAIVYSKIDDIEKSLADYTTAIFINEINRDALLGRADIFVKLGQLRDATKDYESLVSQFDSSKDFVESNSFIFKFLAHQAFENKNFVKAAKYYTDAFKCGNIKLKSNEQLFELATTCSEDFFNWKEKDKDQILHSTTLTSLCLLKIDQSFSDYFGPFSKNLHFFRKNMSNQYFASWKLAKIDVSNPKKKK